MNRIFLIIIIQILTIFVSIAKNATSIAIVPTSENCSKVIILRDDNNDDIFDECLYYISCDVHVFKYYTVSDNYCIKPLMPNYTASLFSGSYEGPDFLYILKETNSGKAVAKLFNIGENNIIIDPLPVNYEPNYNSFDKLDEYFYYLNQHGIITLSKRSDFPVNKIFISDLSGKSIFSSEIDQTTYYIDLSNRADGQYFLNVITPDNYLMKKIILLK